MRAADRGAADRVAPAGSAGRQDTLPSIRLPGAGSHADGLLDLHRIVLGLLGADVALLAVMLAGVSR
ncbi:MAG: hypothetical protein KJZ98_09740 [Burkholderiaceae bacterium]|jgi:hypothetical protein|nr:hypothetical protein [Burkholderiaceae bacterium]MEB2352015.1 hypothetical protein [Burkholderiaceae bacterium]